MCLHCSIGKSVVNTGYSAFPEEIESSNKIPKSSVAGRLRITKYQNIFIKDFNKNWAREMFVIDSVLNTNPSKYTIRNLNRDNY